jgi:hypothetical protein
MSHVELKPRFGAKPADRREFGRRAMFLHALAVTLGGGTWPCHVVDKSDAGARLKVKDSLDFPDLFRLVIESEDLVVQCAVVHRTGEFVGCKFIRSPQKISAMK